ncbi:MAG: dethiobiotin synthase [Planctomycetota bacterium]
MSLERALALENEARRRLGLERRRPDNDVGDGLVDFTSSDVLGQSTDPRLLARALEFGERHGAGARAARLLGGAATASRRAELAAREWLGGDVDALLFPAGYQANVTTIPALVGRGDVILSDALVHASLIDGARQSRAQTRVHRHLDTEHLAHCLERARGARRRLVLTESIFSMDGDTPDLAALAQLCRKHDAALFVDEAHAGGIVGPSGRGACSEVDFDGVTLVRLFTGGKALGAAGAFVVAAPEVVHFLAQASRGSVFSTGVSPLVAGALVAGIELAEAAEAARATLRERVEQLARALGREPGRGPILPHPVGDTERTMRLATELQSAGFDVRGIRAPTVPAGAERLRFVVRAAHTPDEIDGVARALREAERVAPPAPPVEVRSPAPEPVFVVGTDTDVGKTVASALLVRVARRLGAVRYLKPVQTGDDSDTETVARLAQSSAGERLEPIYHFALPASPHEAARAAGRTLERDALEAGFRQARAEAGDARLIVELAGGLLVPYDDAGYDQAAFLAAHAREVVLVARAGLGTLNHTQLTLEALERRGLVPRALILSGAPHPSNRATLAPLVRRLIELPHLPELTPGALDAWIDAHFESDGLRDLLP